MKYPIGIQTFEDIRRQGYVYVDKTEYIYKLASAGKCYFLSRPRRFGKSLLLSTMDAYFSGKKELFKGLAIEKLEKDWPEYPVLRVDFTTGDYMCEGGLEERLNATLDRLERIARIESAKETPSVRFERLIERACEKNKRQVVILIDEYDKPLLDPIDNPQMQDSNRELLRKFYSAIKSQDQYIRFAFLTGITKFSHVNIFSGLNNLEDISMVPQYASVCGITESELADNFGESIRDLARSQGMTFEQTCARLKEQYDGYHFYQNTEGVYNPFSLLRTFKSGIFADYWFQTGTPTYLVKTLAKFDVLPTKIGNIQVPASGFETLSDRVNWIPLLYQSGYLTISGYDEDSGLYTLDIPNGEVRAGLFSSLVPIYVGKDNCETSIIIAKLAAALKNGRVDDAMQEFVKAFSSLPYGTGTNTENNYQQLMAAFLLACGFVARLEERTAQGRIDIVFDTRKYIYVFELKLDGSAEEALRQIEERDYAARYAANDPRPIIKVGVNFSSSTRTIDEWKVEE